MPLSDLEIKFIELPPWRRARFSGIARVRHWLGHHTYVDTLYPAFEEGLLVSLDQRRECWVCGRLA